MKHETLVIKRNQGSMRGKEKSLNLSGLDSHEGLTIFFLTSGGYLPLLNWDNARRDLWVISSTSILISFLS